MIDIDWVKGAPARLEAGMVVQWYDGQLSIIGHYDERMSVELLDIAQIAMAVDLSLELSEIAAWAWLVKPHELEWIEAIGARKP